jgi:hypothetical protein
MTKIEELAKEAKVDPEVVAHDIREFLLLENAISTKKIGKDWIFYGISKGTKEMFRRWLSDYTDNKIRKEVK